MKILVTGIDGMIGKNFLRSSNMSHHEVLGINRSQVDLHNFSDLYKVIDSFKPELIINFAGLVGGVGDVKSRPFDYFFENTLINLNIYKICYELKINKFINFSSANVFNNIKNLFNNNHNINTLINNFDGYSFSKLNQLFMSNYLKIQSGFSYKTILPCNIYGPYDKFDKFKSQIVPSAIIKTHEAMEKGTNIEIWGDGTSKQEYLFVLDLIDVIWLVIDNYEISPDFIEIGSGEQFSTFDIYKKIAYSMGFSPSYIFNINMPNGSDKSLLGNYFSQQFSWKPLFSIDEGLKLTCDYFKQSI